MNDAILHELKRVVEQAVRPVRATMARKRRMREELLAHLVAIFEEEAGKLGDEPAALSQAKHRFGDPRELTGPLQETVPRWDRCRSILENMGCQPGESALHLAAKHFLAALMIYAVALFAVKPTMLILEQLYRGTSWVFPLETLLKVGFVLVLFNATLSLTLAPLLNKIGPVLAGKRWGRILLALLCGLALPFALSGAFGGAAVVFILMARQTVKQWRYQADWA